MNCPYPYGLGFIQDRRAADILDGFLAADAGYSCRRRELNPLGVVIHPNRVPRAVFGAERAADTAFNIDLDHLLKLGDPDIGNDFDAVHRTKNNAGFTACTAALVDDG